MSTHTPMTDFGPVPKGWLWGTATAAHQIEGGNTNNDWWHFENAPNSAATEPSGDACDSWNRWREDVALVADIGLGMYRFSLEWSRIEPSDGDFSEEALEHYREIIEECHRLGLQACVTFHHFTLPVWVADRGGIDSPDFPELFARFCARAAERLGDVIDLACTINEPNVLAMAAYFLGTWPPEQRVGIEGFARVTENLLAAHRAAATALRVGPGDYPVGMALAIADMTIHPDGTWDGPGLRADDLPADLPVVQFRRLMMDAYLEAAREDDFIGIQTYSEVRLGPDGQQVPIPDHVRKTQMPWTYSPEALGATVALASKATGVPVLVTENGCPTADDEERIEYISRALTSLRGAMDAGANVIGYTYWSLLDNFEWANGYGPTFGLVACDRVTFERTPKPSAAYYGSIAAASRG